jgi:hypothetical protein
MNDDVMYNKIAQTVSKNSQSNEESVIKTVLCTKIKQKNAWNGKDYEKNVVSFENMGVFGLVMISMKTPQKTVHNEFMSTPSDTFHQ